MFGCSRSQHRRLSSSLQRASHQLSSSEHFQKMVFILEQCSGGFGENYENGKRNGAFKSYIKGFRDNFGKCKVSSAIQSYVKEGRGKC